MNRQQIEGYHLEWVEGEINPIITILPPAFGIVKATEFELIGSPNGRGKTFRVILPIKDTNEGSKLKG